MTCEIKIDTKSGRKYFEESFSSSVAKFASSESQGMDSSFYQGLPEKIWPQITAINANTLTRNNTYYPTESLIGDPSTGSGYRSALYPYPIPLIRDHLAAPSQFTGKSSHVYGRVKVAKFISNGRGGGYTMMIPEVTHPEGIFNILNKLWLTVSIGVTSEELYCGICGADLIQLGPGGCGHMKGESYIVGGQEVVAFWKVGPVFHQELSAVVVPSDTGAQINIPDIGEDGLKKFSESSSSTYTFRSTLKKEFCMKKLTLGALFTLDESHPDYNTESTLSAKQRDSLPASVFCGPGRSFPAPDASHAAYGLSVLKNYKGDGDKTEIKACLERRLKSFKDSHEPLVVLLDPKTQIQTSILEFSGNVEEDLEKLGTLNFSEAENNRVKGLLVYHATKAAIELPESVKSFAPAGDSSPITVEINADTYPLLYHAVNESKDSSAELVENIVNKYLEAEGLITAESDKYLAQNTELTEKVKELETKLTEMETAAPTVVLTEGVVSVDEAVAAKELALTEAKTLIESLEAQNELQKTSIKALQENTVQLENDRHNSLALNVAMLKKLARRRTAMHKSMETLVKEASSRTRASLVDEYNELSEELKETLNLGVEVKTLESITNPVLQETKLDVDPVTGYPILSDKITESDEGKSYLVGLVNPADVSKRVEQERSRILTSRR